MQEFVTDLVCCVEAHFGKEAVTEGLEGWEWTLECKLEPGLSASHSVK